MYLVSKERFLVLRYDHLVDVIHKILSQKPPDVVDQFEQYSWEVKKEKFRPNFDLLNDIYLSPPQLRTVRRVEEMFQVYPPTRRVSAANLFT